jgi:hypothetical protein
MKNAKRARARENKIKKINCRGIILFVLFCSVPFFFSSREWRKTDREREKKIKVHLASEESRGGGGNIKNLSLAILLYVFSPLLHAFHLYLHCHRSCSLAALIYLREIFFFFSRFMLFAFCV